ncbi:MAG TPA: thioesterase family protein [Phenylobacterium sp.]
MSRLFEPPPGRQVFTRDYTPATSDIDENGHVNNVVYLRWAQEMAIAHWNARAPDDAKAAWAWVVLRHEVDYRRQLLPGENAHARTWVAEAAAGPRFDRFVRIDGPGGVMCAQAQTVWCLVDLPSRRPRRVPEWMVELFT